MAITFTNTELSRSVAGLIRPSNQNPTPIQGYTTFDRVSNNFQPLIRATRQSTRNSRSCVLSMSKNSTSESLTYKEAGVDIDAGSELVRRIAKMAPNIGGFGGLFPLGI